MTFRAKFGSARAIAHTALLILLAADTFAKSVSGFLNSHALSSSRSLSDSQAALEQDEATEESLAQACAMVDGVEAFFQGGTSGEVCQLAAAVISRGSRRIYNFELANQHQDLSLQIHLQRLEGRANIKFEHQRDDLTWEDIEMQLWDSGNAVLFIPKQLNAGSNRIVIISEEIVSTFSMRVEFFRGNVVIKDDALVVLKLIREKCCNSGDGCWGVLADVADETKQKQICASAGNHCDTSGALTHLDLAESNMDCDLSDVQFPLGALNELQVLMLNKNNVRGNLNDPQVSKFLGELTQLQILDLGNLPGLTGNIDPSCGAPFTNLVRLGLSNTSVGGQVPACIVNQVHQLEISSARFEGSFPEISADANLRYLVAHTEPDSQWKLTGPFPSIENSGHLHYINVNNQDFEGTITVSNHLEAVLAENNRISALKVPNAPQLQLLDLAGNQLVGEVPVAVPNLPELVGLHLDGNKLTALPSIWGTSKLRDITASRNQIQGDIPAVFGSLPHLRRVILDQNQLSGGLDDFSAEIPAHSKLQWFDIGANKFSGTLFAPALKKLGAFSSSDDEYQDEWDRQSPHFFIADGNDLRGEISEELINSYAQQLEDDVLLVVDLSNNPNLKCPSNKVLKNSGLGSDELALLGCSVKRTGHTVRRALVGLLIAFLIVGLCCGGAVFYKRRQNKRGWYRDPGVTATAYVDSAEASRLTGQGSGGGWLSGKPNDNKQFAAGLDEPTGGGNAWGFMPFMKRSKQPASSLLGGWSRAETEAQGPMSRMSSGGGLQLPVSGARRDMSIKTNTALHSQKAGAAVTSVELASPMSDVSANSLPRNGGGVIGIDGDDGDDGSFDGGRHRGRGNY